jgi:acyl-[acyl-carrier-protein]-phospholipid O-acyltransferase/long-chain-fatty-acid--[acyl-carrier-protein] ligase
MMLVWTGAGILFLLAAFVVYLAYLSRRHPDLVVRIVLWLPSRLLYRIRVFGRENVPATGPALLVCNHVSFIDAFLVFLAQRRLIRFVIWAPFTRVPGLRLLLRLTRVIPLDAAGPRSLVKSLHTASEALKKGEVVCIFAEGCITRTGFLLPFNRGFEQILKHSPAPIIPVCLDHVWGSIFSHQGGRFFWKWPQKLPYPVTVAFGPPLPATARAVEVRQAIQKLSADSAIARSAERLPVHRQFLRMACRHPFRRCLIDTVQNRKFRYGEVLAGAWMLAGRLKTITQNEPMIGLWLPPSAAGVFANMAVTLLGKTSVSLNYTLPVDGVKSCIQQCRIRHVLTSRMFASKVPLEAPGDVELVYLEDFRGGVSTWERLRKMSAILVLPAVLLERWLGLHRHGPEDLATVIFSSGSTGDPKGIMLLHRNLSANVESMIQAIDPRPTDVLVGILPFFHSFGYTVTLWVPMQVGATGVYYADPRQAKEIGEMVHNYGGTIFLTTPTLLRICLRRCEPDDFKSVRLLMVGAEKLPPNLAKEFKERYGVLPLEGYGCTELSPAACVNVPDWEDGSVQQIGNKPGTIGQPIPGVAAQVVDPETFALLPPETEGMLVIYGGNVMKGYLGRPEATREVIRDGWYVTGDIARYDEDGFITITDRLARFSKIGGEMVPHQKIEDELHQILGTNDRMCVVTSVPDEKKGERLIVLHTAFNGIERHHLWKKLSDRGLPNLWIPSERDFILVQEFPVLGSGKVDLKRIRQMALEKTGAK